MATTLHQPSAVEHGEIGAAPSQTTRPQKIVAIINPVSCPLGVDPMRDDLSRALARHGAEAEYFETCETETALPIAKREIEAGATLVLAIGGDGTIMESINAVIGTEVAVGIIPAGTGNLLAANLGIPTTLDEAVDVALTGRSMQLDLVSVDGGKKYFAIMGGLGYDAEIMRETPREVKRKIGKLAYTWTALKELRGHRFAVEIQLDDRNIVVARAKSLLIANMGEVVKGVKLFPDADPTDGVIDVGILKAANWAAFLRTVWHTLRGKPQDSPYFDRYAARKVAVKARRDVPFELDGEDLGNARTFVAEVAPKAAHVMVPAAAQQRT